MNINIRSDSVEIEGYVNAIERNSKPLWSRLGQFVERICKGAFSNALKRNEDVKVLLNHDQSRVLGSTKDGSLVLTEDNIGLHARAVITDSEVIQKAKHGDLVGWSFGFYDTPDGVDNGTDQETKLPLRKVRDMDLREVSILDKSKTPAYDGTLIMARSDENAQFYGEAFCDQVIVTRSEPDYSEYEQWIQDVKDNKPDYTLYERWISDMKEERFNPNHDSKGRFSSGSGGGSTGRKYFDTDTSDAVAEWKEKENSLLGNVDENGKLTPERDKQHKDIIDKELEGKVPVDGQATMTMLGGGPASGKSTVMSTKKKDLDEHTVVVNPDNMKPQLDGYADYPDLEKRAGFYHEESSALAKRFYSTALSENYNAIYDGTGDGSEKSVMKKIDEARANGYRVEGKYVTVSVEEALKRNLERYEKAKAKNDPEARLPNPDYVRSCHAKVTDISVATAPKFDHIELWDNNGGVGEQKLIAIGGNGKYFTPVKGQESAFQAFLAKGERGLDGFITLPDGQVIPAPKK